MINPTSAVPLYVQVADDLRRRIEMGEFSESGVLPSENGFAKNTRLAVRRYGRQFKLLWMTTCLIRVMARAHLSGSLKSSRA